MESAGHIGMLLTINFRKAYTSNNQFTSSLGNNVTLNSFEITSTSLSRQNNMYFTYKQQIKLQFIDS